MSTTTDSDTPARICELSGILSRRYDTLVIRGDDSKLGLHHQWPIQVSFRRTYISDAKESDPPADFGPYLLSQVDGPLGRNLPDHMRKKGGVLFPMYDREAVSIFFESYNKPFAVKMYAGGVNCISGRTIGGQNDTTDTAGCPKEQDYIVTHLQKRLDGIAVGDGKVRQFIAAPNGAGYSIEAQITNAEDVGGLQFDITPLRLRGYAVLVEGESGLICSIAVSDRYMSVEELKLAIHGSVHRVDLTLQRLFFAGSQLMDARSLEYYTIDEGSIIQLAIYRPLPAVSKPPRFTTDGNVDDDFSGHYQSATSVGEAERLTTEPDEMNLAAGGYIQQHIMKDDISTDRWDWDNTVAFNVQIFNADVWESVTGIPMEPPHPFIQMQNQKYGGVYGKSFDAVQSRESLEARMKLEQGIDLRVTLNPEGSLSPDKTHRCAPKSATVGAADKPDTTQV